MANIGQWHKYLQYIWVRHYQPTMFSWNISQTAEMVFKVKQLKRKQVCNELKHISLNSAWNLNDFEKAKLCDPCSSFS